MGKRTGSPGTWEELQLPATPSHHKLLFQGISLFKPRSPEIGLRQHAYLTPSPPEPLFPEFSCNPSPQAPTTPHPILQNIPRPREAGASPSALPLTAPAVSVPSTVKSLRFLTGSQLLHMRPAELQMLCPQEAPRVLARLEAVRRMLGVRTPWGPDSHRKCGMLPGWEGECQVDKPAGPALG